MKEELTELFANALRSLIQQGVLPADSPMQVQLERARQKEHGDLATNLALTLAKSAQQSPRDLAQKIIAALPDSGLITKLEIAGPGFINIFLRPATHFAVLRTIQQQSNEYGHNRSGAKEKVLLEFVSANPTGPLHVGHGRGAAYGDSLARILKANGYQVTAEYYINDAGRQMDILAVSVWLRYLELCGNTMAFPANCYQGDYIFDIAASVHRQDGDVHQRDATPLIAAQQSLDAEAGLDALISGAKELLQEGSYQRFFSIASQTLVDDIRNDLEQFNVHYDSWFSETSLHQELAVTQVVERLKSTEYLYQQDGAWWFKARAFGDEKDRVVVRENGAPTYFAADIAYHLNKFERGFDRLIDIWGADHHGYIDRVKGAVQALGYEAEKLHIALVQFAVLYRGGQKVSMSTRSGEFVTLRELRNEVGTDAARFFYVQRKAEQHMDFDLDLAKSQSNDNPVYYVQYAHARICSVFKIAEERDIDTGDLTSADLSLLTEEHEMGLAISLNRFPEIIAHAARDLEPHQIVYYLRELANDLHTYYNAHRFIDAEAPLRTARLALISATRQVIANGLRLIGVSAPESM